jgi:hypothetical protein
MIGAKTITAYRVLEVISLFPRLETLKMKNFRWDVINGIHWVPFPTHLRHFDVDIENVLNPAAFLFALFREGEERQETTFSLRVDKDYAGSLQEFDDVDSQSQHRKYFSQVLKNLHRVMPGIENLELEVPMDSVKSEDGGRRNVFFCT